MPNAELTQDQLYMVQSATLRANEAVEHARNAIANIDGETADVRAARLKMHCCATCAHLRGGYLSGQMFTKWHCRVCDKEEMHHNTSVPYYCGECAEAYQLCIRCGGTLDGKMRKTASPRKK